MKFFHTLKFKIIFSCVSVSCLLVIIFGTFFYQNAKTSHINQQTINLTSKLNIVMNSIDQDYSQLYRLCTSLSNDKIITAFLNSQEDLLKQDTFQLVSAYNECTRLLVNLGIYDLFSKGILTSDSNDYTINFGLIHGHSSDYDYFMEQKSHLRLNAPDHIVSNPFFYGGDGYIIPFQMPIYAYQSVHIAGSLFVGLDAKILTKNFSANDIATNGSLYIIMKDQVYAYDGRSIADITDRFACLPFPIAEQLDSRTYRTAPIPELDDHEFIYVQSNSTGWAIMQQITPYSLTAFKPIGTGPVLAILLMVSLIFTFFYTYLNHSINRPINTLISQLNDIAKGNFSVQDTSNHAAEFKMIHLEINNMASALDKLIATTLENEKQKKAYEFKILQSQINPHFLYNTLNSIRWMGEINGMSGIVEITTALASMLRTIARVSSQFVPIKTELSFIRDYTTIQHYRYGNIFTTEYRIEDDSLNQAKIIKFILQPLVENAIFHGIEPSGRQGNILIHVFSEGTDLIIQVRDNGIGISPEQLETLNRHEAHSSDRDIGLDNIHKRLVLEYGTSYGLFVESCQNSYTTVTLRIPLEFETESL